MLIKLHDISTIISIFQMRKLKPKILDLVISRARNHY